MVRRRLRARSLHDAIKRMDDRVDEEFWLSRRLSFAISCPCRHWTNMMKHQFASSLTHLLTGRTHDDRRERDGAVEMRSSSLRGDCSLPLSPPALERTQLVHKKRREAWEKRRGCSAPPAPPPQDARDPKSARGSPRGSPCPVHRLPNTGNASASIARHWPSLLPRWPCLRRPHHTLGVNLASRQPPARTPAELPLHACTIPSWRGAAPSDSAWRADRV
jgi:hypothetical protein